MAEMIGYWFASEPRLPHGDNRAVLIGETLRIGPPIKLCRQGLHASEHPFDALEYAGGALLYQVRLSGKILRDDDKACATERTALAMIDARALLRTFARQQALSVIHLWKAPEIVLKYLETGDDTLRADAREAARHARFAAWATARDSAWAAARDVPWDAAWAAAWAARWTNSSPIERSAKWAAARQTFGDMVVKEFAKQEQDDV